jgi:hypothetical protein
LDISGTYINLGDSFIENLILLLLAIGLTSFLIPLIFKHIEERKLRLQQEAEIENERQNTIVAAQIELLDRLTEQLWTYQFLAAMVLYSRQRQTGRDDLYLEAAGAYDTQSGEVLARLRSEISGLLRLAPRTHYERFLHLLANELLPYDHCLLELMRQHEMSQDGKQDEEARCGPRGDRFANAGWADIERYLEHDLGRMTDDAIASLADELQLSVNALRPTARP